MYFKIEKDGRCDSELQYGYFSTVEEIGIAARPSLFVISKSSSTTSFNGRITSSTKYFTIKKKLKNTRAQMGIIFY